MARETGSEEVGADREQACRLGTPMAHVTTEISQAAH